MFNRANKILHIHNTVLRCMIQFKNQASLFKNKVINSFLLLLYTNKIQLYTDYLPLLLNFQYQLHECSFYSHTKHIYPQLSYIGQNKVDDLNRAGGNLLNPIHHLKKLQYCYLYYG